MILASFFFLCFFFADFLEERIRNIYHVENINMFFSHFVCAHRKCNLRWKQQQRVELFQRDPGANNISGVHLRHHTNKYTFFFEYFSFDSPTFVCHSYLFIAILWSLSNAYIWLNARRTWHAITVAEFWTMMKCSFRFNDCVVRLSFLLTSEFYVIAHNSHPRNGIQLKNNTNNDNATFFFRTNDVQMDCFWFFSTTFSTILSDTFYFWFIGMIHFLFEFKNKLCDYNRKGNFFRCFSFLCNDNSIALIYF